MTWKEKPTGMSSVYDVDQEREKVLNLEKEVSLPVISKEQSKKDFQQINPQPVISVGIYEGEFAPKGKDIIFHFWPYGYHDADGSNGILPRFPKKFKDTLKKTLESHVSPLSVEMSEDRDMGAWFVRVRNLAEKPFYRELSIKICEDLHRYMGGK